MSMEKEKNEIKKSMGDNHEDVGYFRKKAMQRRKKEEIKLHKKIETQKTKLHRDLIVEKEKELIRKEKAEIVELKRARKGIGAEERKVRAEKIKKVEKGLIKSGKAIGKLFG